MPRCSLLLDLHACAGRSESRLAKHATSLMSPLAKVQSKCSRREPGVAAGQGYSVIRQLLSLQMLQSLSVWRKGVGPVAVTSIDVGRRGEQAVAPPRAGKVMRRKMRNRGVDEESAVRAHGAGVSVSELARGLWGMTNTKDGEVCLCRACCVGLWCCHSRCR